MRDERGSDEEMERSEKLPGGTATTVVRVTAIVVSSLVSPLSIGASVVSRRSVDLRPPPRTP
jgi:hypothetical protein